MADAAASPPPSEQPSLLARLRERIVRIVWPTRQHAAPRPAQRAVVETPRFLDTRLQALLDASVGKSAVLRRVVHDVARGYWEAGYEDACRGQRRAEFDMVARASAEFFQQEFKTAAHAHVSEIEREKTTQVDVLHSVEASFKARAAHFDVISRMFRQNPRSLSRLLAACYLVVAFLLVIADIPLALKLTQQGFDLALGIPELDEFVKYPWLVFQNNWEVVILAAGLALCTVFVKIFYDKHAATVIPELPADTPPGALGDSSRHAGIDYVILALTMATILALGAFRFATIEHEAASGAGALIFTDWSRQVVTLATFVLITLLFPVIGGVCLSLGLNQLHNRSALARAEKEVEDCRLVYLRESEEVEALSNGLTEWTTVRDWCSSGDFARTVIELLRGAYVHGYERGWMEALRSDGDVVTSAFRFRAYVMAHRQRDLVNWGAKLKVESEPLVENIPGAEPPRP